MAAADRRSQRAIVKNEDVTPRLEQPVRRAGRCLLATLAGLALLPWLSGWGTLAGDRLAKGFIRPDAGTRPWVYWYWIDEQISREGITRDLEAMARVGIGEALIGHVSPGLERGPVRMLSDRWWGMVEHAVLEGQRLGVDIGFFNSPGWSQSGGPWITADQAMRCVVHTETRVRGPAQFEGVLPAPEGEYRDLATLAFPMPAEQEAPIRVRQPLAETPGASRGVERMFDGDTNTAFVFPRASGTGRRWQMEFVLEGDRPVQGVSLHPVGHPFQVQVELLVSSDGRQYEPLRRIHFDRRRTMWNLGPMTWAPLTLACPAVAARHFRLVFSELDAPGDAGFREIVFTGSPTLDYLVEKQLGKMHPEPLPGWDAYLWPPQAEPTATLAPGDVRNISGQMQAGGRLRWNVPEGDWVILRCGTLPTGAVNEPVPPEAKGYEVDKMSREGSRHHFAAYIGAFLGRVPPERRRALKHVVIDSYEVGSQNWTPGLERVFVERLGYDPVPWLPVLSGRVVGSADLSNRFLWDLRRLVADLIAENYLGAYREAVNAGGLKLWMENYGHWGFPAEFLQYGGQADIISGEFWYRNHLWDLGSIELRGASSASHTYGKPITSAEAFTAGFNFRQSPAAMKSRGDWAFTQGINHFVLHLYIHQPWEDRKPGVTAWFGMSYQRHNTWFEQSRPWIDYLRRCHYLLQQGGPTADLLYFIGEDTPKMSGILDPPRPRGYDFDFVNAEVIQKRLSVRDGLLTLPEGVQYRMLVLPPLDTMRPELLAKIGELVRAGAVVVGPPPRRSPSLSGYPGADAEVKRRADEIWGPCNGVQATEHRHGKGRVFHGVPLPDVLSRLGAVPDVVCGDSSVLWTHRRGKGFDVYFLSNQSDQAREPEIAFRVGARIPEFWSPVTGEIRRIARFRTAGDSTHVKVPLGGQGSLFVVFRERSRGGQVTDLSPAPGALSDGGETADQAAVWYARDSREYIATRARIACQVRRADGRSAALDSGPVPAPLDVAGSWTLCFPPGWDCPDRIVLDKLRDWRESPIEGVRHFSGTARYQTMLDIPEDYLARGDRVWLDLGAVETIAAVKVNGQALGVLWCSPYAVDITGAARPGANAIEIEVTNLWWNRLVGDAKYPGGFPDGRGGFTGDAAKTFTTHKAWGPREELEPSGLLGPVQLQVERHVPLP